MAKKQFKSESKRLLDLMINSIYTHKEIFLRELISNASDAIDKLCFISLTDNNVGLSREDFKINLTLDKENRKIVIEDNGIGMDKDEVVAISRKIDTFETSILPYEDCCTVFTPKHPKTKPKLSQLEEAEKLLDVDSLVKEAVENTKFIMIDR